MDNDWAIAELDRFAYLTEHVMSDHPGVIGFFMRGPSDEADQQVHVVEQILDRALPGWRQEPGRSDEAYQHEWLRERTLRAKAALARAAELAEKLGDNAPEVGPANLHPWAWESGKSLWNGRFYHQAVMEAAKRVNIETQAKLGRFDTSEVDLFNQAFSLDVPQPGKPRLRLAPDDGGDTYKNLHKGARSFADGLYTAIRNPGMHTPAPADGGEEQLALEQLAAFSLLARWVDQATVQRA